MSVGEVRMYIIERDKRDNPVRLHATFENISIPAWKTLDICTFCEKKAVVVVCFVPGAATARCKLHEYLGV